MVCIGNVFDEIVVAAQDAAAVFRGKLIGAALGRIDAAVRGASTLDGRVQGAGPVGALDVFDDLYPRRPQCYR